MGVTRQPPQRRGGDSETRLTIRVDFGAHGALGPGKIRLMELIGEKGSITAAGRAMKMSYRRAWLLVDALNRMFREPLIETQHFTLQESRETPSSKGVVSMNWPS